MTTVVEQRNVPDTVRSLSTLAKQDYVDLFTVTAGAAADGSPEQWARAAVDDAAGLAGQFVWRVLLGLRLEWRPSPAHVAGWKIVHRGDSWIVLEAASWFLTAQIVVQVGDGQVSVATFIRYDRPVAALVWPALSVGHRQAMPGLLRHAAKVMASRGSRTRLPNSAHEARPWVIGEIAPDFKLLDVWALPVRGDLHDFHSFLEAMASLDPADGGSTVSRALFQVRLRLGDWFGWDDATKQRPIPGCSETTLAARLPDRLRGSAKGPLIGETMQRAAGGFSPLYRTDDEWAAEISNDTVHGVLHLGWVEESDGRYRAQMGVYVKPRGWLGEVYLKLIEPFRHLIVYPALMRQIGRAWDARDIARPTPPATLAASGT